LRAGVSWVQPPFSGGCVLGCALSLSLLFRRRLLFRQFFLAGFFFGAAFFGLAFCFLGFFLVAIGAVYHRRSYLHFLRFGN
jgi:hypothetical protein